MTCSHWKYFFCEWLEVIIHNIQNNILLYVEHNWIPLYLIACFFFFCCCLLYCRFRRPLKMCIMFLFKSRTGLKQACSLHRWMCVCSDPSHTAYASISCLTMCLAGMQRLRGQGPLLWLARCGFTFHKELSEIHQHSANWKEIMHSWYHRSCY